MLFQNQPSDEPVEPNDWYPFAIRTDGAIHSRMAVPPDEAWTMPIGMSCPFSAFARRM